MFTVFCVETEEPEELLSDLMQDFNTIEPELLEKTVGGVNGFKGASCSIHDSDIWSEHCDKMEEFVAKFSRALNGNKNSNLYFCFDVAVWHRDLDGLACRVLPCDLDLIKMLHKYNVGIVFSFYTGDDES